MNKIFSLIVSVLLAGGAWAGDVNVKHINPGSSAESLGKDRGSAAGSQDRGVAVYGMRRDVLVPLEEADGQYTGPKYDSTGKLWVHNGDLIALTVSFTPDDTPNYTAGFAFGPKLEFIGASLVAGGTVEIVAAIYYDTASLQGTSVPRLYLLDRTFSATTDNESLTFSDAELKQIHAYISFNGSDADAQQTTFADNGLIRVQNINQIVDLEASTTSIFAQASCEGASNYPTGQTITFTLFVRRM